MQYPDLDTPISPLRQRLIDDMNMRRFSRETQRNYIRDIGRLAVGSAAQVERWALPRRQGGGNDCYYYVQRSLCPMLRK